MIVDNSGDLDIALSGVLQRVSDPFADRGLPVEDEVREVIGDTFLKDAAIVRTSAVTGAGMDDLRDALTAAASLVEEVADLIRQ